MDANNSAARIVTQDRPHAADALPSRLDSVDILRGLVIVLMALDHTRDFFGYNPGFQPEDLDATTPGWFFTRWVTHFCAPVFVFLAGTGAYMHARRHASVGLSRYLLTRGLWLIVLEFTVVRFGWSFDVSYRGEHAGVMLGVIWAIGASMVALAGLVRLPLWAIGSLGVAIIAGHNLLDGIDADDLPGRWSGVWTALHEGWKPIDIGGFTLFVVYPLMPWVGVMAAGYSFGAVMAQRNAKRRRRSLLALGLGLMVAFIVLRAVDAYGDPRPWAPHDRGNLFTVMSFINATKYPPSLSYLLMTLGPAVALLAALELARGPVAAFLRTFGRVPLFFYLVHLPVIHGLALAGALAIYGPRALEFGPGNVPEGYTPRLWLVYAAWVVIVGGLYPPCRWFAGVKRRRREWWLSYL